MGHIADDELEAILAEVASNAGTITVPRVPSLLEDLGSYAFFAFLSRAASFKDATVMWLRDTGLRFIDRVCARGMAIDAVTMDIIKEAAGEQSLDTITRRKLVFRASGIIDPIRFLEAKASLLMLCGSYGTLLDRECLSYGIPVASGRGISAFFFMPAFYWDIWKSVPTNEGIGYLLKALATWFVPAIKRKTA